MAETIRKLAVYLGLVEDTARWQDDYDDAEMSWDQDPNAERQEVADASAPQHPGTVSVLPKSRSATIKPVTLHPRSYNDVLLVGQYFREGAPVIMDVTSMTDGDAKRLVDFGAGLIFGLHGDISRVHKKVFLLTPASITVTTESQAS